ncbi:MAG: dihydrofolate reductase [Prolixibacteraceae bacterium]|nr:dihydrofolate reductase [Prolixibacteraceae bacterium]
MPNERKIILYIAMSLDGFIAKHDDDISFLAQVEQEGEDYGYSAFTQTVDTVILGRKTYDKVLSMGLKEPYGDRQVFVLTRNPHHKIDKITFYSGSLSDLVSSLKSETGKHIFCDGGAETVHQFLQNDLFDELIISIIPILLGDGIRLFGQCFPEQKLRLVESKSFEKGLVQLHYIRIRD